MTTPEYESFLPRVESDDILSLVFEDVTDTNHTERWLRFAKAHPVLAAEILGRTLIESRESVQYDKHTGDLQKRMMENVIFAVNALEMAAERLRGGVSSRDLEKLSDGVDDEDQQLST
jgi:pyrroloquinoline quinone (PQQ) biosynthesis protein C